jgi:hypothetical protein
MFIEHNISHRIYYSSLLLAQFFVSLPFFLILENSRWLFFPLRKQNRYQSNFILLYCFRLSTATPIVPTTTLQGAFHVHENYFMAHKQEEEMKLQQMNLIRSISLGGI